METRIPLEARALENRSHFTCCDERFLIEEQVLDASRFHAVATSMARAKNDRAVMTQLFDDGLAIDYLLPTDY